MWFLYTGKPDEDGEYPVFVLDVDDQYLVELGAPNFAVWLASLCEVGGAGLSLGGPNLVGFASLIANSDLAALMRKQSRLNFGGYRYCEVYGTAVTADGQQTQWCRQLCYDPVAMLRDLMGWGICLLCGAISVSEARAQTP
jgi:hypothetical protein